MAYTIKTVCVRDLSEKPSNMIFREKKNAEDYLKRGKNTNLGDDVWMSPWKENVDDIEFFLIEELNYEVEE